MITVYKSFPSESSQNVGDKLIGEAATNIIEQTTNDEVIAYFDEQDLLDNVEDINESKALFIPAFGIRSSIWRPKLAEAINNGKIEVPIIPMGAAWSDFPGDYDQITSNKYPNYSTDVIDFYRTVVDSAPVASSRDYYTQRVLSQINISTEMVGDCAWYDLNNIGNKMYRPKNIDSLVVTDPHQSQYYSQMLKLMEKLKSNYTDAKRYFCVHGVSESRNINNIILKAEKLGFEYKNMSNDVSNLDLYSNCDLHVGYRVHGHVGFLRQRRPSVLLCEDGRGLGFTETLGGGGFPAFNRQVSASAKLPQMVIQTFPNGLIRYVRNKYSSEPNSVIHPVFPPSDSVVERIIDFISQELSNGWQRYDQIPSVIDTTYKNRMQPFIRKAIDHD